MHFYSQFDESAFMYDDSYRNIIKMIVNKKSYNVC